MTDSYKWQRDFTTYALSQRGSKNIVFSGSTWAEVSIFF